MCQQLRETNPKKIGFFGAMLVWTNLSDLFNIYAI